MKYVVVGGVAGGATAAARIRRNDEKGKIVLFERGEHISFANCGLPYYIGGEIEQRRDLLLLSVTAFSNRYDIDVRIKTLVCKIEPKEKRVLVKNLATNKEYYESYDKLILSPGAEPFIPEIPGIASPRVLKVRNIPDIDLIREKLVRDNVKKVTVVGGGFIGLEMAENLTLFGSEVTLVEMASQVMQQVDYPIAAMIHKELSSNGVRLLLSNSVTRFQDSGKELDIHLKNGITLKADLVIWCTGVKPENSLATDAGLEIGDTGGIKVDSGMKTSDPDIFAIGDAVETKHLVTGKPVLALLAGPANKQARIAADNAVFGDVSRYNGTVATGIARIFSLTVAFTGASSSLLKKEGIEHISSYTHSYSHAVYFPGACEITINTIFSPENGKVLGAQIAGKEGVDKRIDLFSQVVRHGGTIYELAEIEHSYAPPFSSAKDPVNIAGYVAENIARGRLKIIHTQELVNENCSSVVYLDVRSQEEYEQGAISGSVNIPQEELRFRLDELPEGKHIIIYCAVGMRAYLAYRILASEGFNNISVLSGGYVSYLTHEQERLRLNKA